MDQPLLVLVLLGQHYHNNILPAYYDRFSQNYVHHQSWSFWSIALKIAIALTWRSTSPGKYTNHREHHIDHVPLIKTSTTCSSSSPSDLSLLQFTFCSPHSFTFVSGLANGLHCTGQDSGHDAVRVPHGIRSWTCFNGLSLSKCNSILTWSTTAIGKWMEQMWRRISDNSPLERQVATVVH